MKNALYAPPLALLVLLGACTSPSQQQSVDPANAANVASADNGWQALRGKYMDCVQRHADEDVPGNTQTKAVVSAALDACKGELNAMHDAFHDYLDAQMVSAHGKSGARQAANRVTSDTREKARTYLMHYVDYERYLAKSH